MNAIDANVLVYAVDSSEPAKAQRAQQLLIALERESTPFVLPW